MKSNNNNDSGSNIFDILDNPLAKFYINSVLGNSKSILKDQSALKELKDFISNSNINIKELSWVHSNDDTKVYNEVKFLLSKGSIGTKLWLATLELQNFKTSFGGGKMITELNQGAQQALAEHVMKCGAGEKVLYKDIQTIIDQYKNHYCMEDFCKNAANYLDNKINEITTSSEYNEVNDYNASENIKLQELNDYLKSAKISDIPYIFSQEKLSPMIEYRSSIFNDRDFLNKITQFTDFSSNLEALSTLKNNDATEKGYEAINELLKTTKEKCGSVTLGIKFWFTVIEFYNLQAICFGGNEINKLNKAGERVVTEAAHNNLYRNMKIAISDFKGHDGMEDFCTNVDNFINEQTKTIAGEEFPSYDTDFGW